MSYSPKLFQLCEVIEEIDIKFNAEYFKIYAGLHYDENVIKQLSKQKYLISKKIISEFKEPRRLFLASVFNIIEYERLDAQLKLFEAKNKKIVDEKYVLGNKPVNWSTWRQFNAQTEDHIARKHVFDTFISRVPLISPLEEEFFQTSKKITTLYGTTPLEAYLEFESLSYNSLKNLINQLGGLAKSDFQRGIEYYAQEILKKEPEYYDDYYLFRGKIYRPINKYFKDRSPVKEVSKVLTTMGFDLSKIKVDGEDRPKKHPSAMCWGIQVPNDIRILFKPVSPFTDIASVFHEFGHGIHDASANPEDPYWKRYLISMGVAETFSILIESLMDTSEFLKSHFGFNDKIIADIVNRRHFMNLYFLTFYSANSITKLQFWKEEYSLEETNKVYEEMTERFMGIRIPGPYWQLHHIMSEHDLYAPSYLIAAVRVGELTNLLTKEYGSHWWESKEAGAFIRELASQRADIDLSWSKLDPKYYVKNFASISI